MTRCVRGAAGVPVHPGGCLGLTARLAHANQGGVTAADRCFVAEGDPPSKRAILQAALRLFVRHGLDGTNVRMIGAEAGYTNPALFKFFKSKQALALHLFERCYLRLAAPVEAAAARPEFSAALAGVIEAFLAAMEEDLEAVLFVQDSLRALWPEVAPPVRRHSMLRALGALMQRGLREGAVRGYHSAEVPVAVLVGTMAQLGRMLYFEELEGPPRARTAEASLAITRMLKG